MNRALLILLIPALLVVAGYIVVLRSMGVDPGYARLIVTTAIFFGAIYWLARRTSRKVRGNAP